MGESLAVFLVLMYDIVITLFVGFLVYCLIAKRVIAASGWTYRDRNPDQYRKKMVALWLLAIVLVALRLVPLPFGPLGSGV